MVQGDIHVLTRIAKADRRASKAACKLKRKLDRSKRNRKHRDEIVQGKPAPVLPIGFASSSHIIAHGQLPRVRDRLLNATGEDTRRLFYVSDIVSGFEDVVALIVSCRSKRAHVGALCDTISGVNSSTHQVSESGVLLFTTDHDIAMGDRKGRNVVVYKVHASNGMFVFYATVLDETVAPHAPRTSPPWGLGLDKPTFRRIQSEVAKMTSVDLVR